jgi:hypothetical protein
MSSVLQSLRLKGRATAEEIATSIGANTNEVTNELQLLAQEHLVVERTSGKRPGWMLTGEGREMYDATLTNMRTPDVIELLTQTYQDFLQLNAQVKELCAQWQATDDDAGRFEVIDELHEIQDKVSPSLTSAGELVPRFGAYATRLAGALTRSVEDHRYVVSPSVDSYHTVWFECHEDYLLMLGKSREHEGSW